jgi:hypothetical protein
MSSASHAVGLSKVKHSGHARRFVRWLACAGYAGRGAVFLILGGFAVLAAFNHTARPVGTTTAVRDLLGTPAGWVLALLIVASLFCFAAFRAIEAILDLHDFGSDLTGALRRAALGMAGLFYGGLAIVASAIVLGWNAASADNQTVRGWTGWLLGVPGGDWIVGLAGAATVAVGIGLAVAGLRASFKRRVRIAREPRPYVTALGMVGMTARSVVFVMIGAFLVFAAVTHDPQKAEGFGGALSVIQHQPYGDWLLGVTALGLLTFGLFGIGEALFADIEQTKSRKR